MSQDRVRYFELREGKSQKFWEITLSGSEYTVRFGRIGSRGQSNTKSFTSEDAAKQAANKLMWQKHDKGYVYVSADGAPSAESSAPHAASGDFGWGGISQVRNDAFRSKRVFHIPRFEKDVNVALGEEDDEEQPTEAELSEFAALFQRFLDSIDEHYAVIQKQAFEQYERLYAHYYENEEKSGAPPLNIRSAQAHAKHVKLDEVRVQGGATIRLIFDYDLDPEHGLEVALRDNAFWRIGGISDVVW